LRISCESLMRGFPSNSTNLYTHLAAEGARIDHHMDHCWSHLSH